MNDRKFYRMDNPYLTFDDKIAVEAWFQAPGDFMLYAFWGMLIYSLYTPVPWYWILGIPMIFSTVLALIFWNLYNRSFFNALKLTLFHNWTTGVLGVLIGALLAYHGQWVWAIVSAVVGIFGFIVLDWWMIVYTIFAKSRYNMHPKYAFFKKWYGYSFPFENNE